MLVVCSLQGQTVNNGVTTPAPTAGNGVIDGGGGGRAGASGGAFVSGRVAIDDGSPVPVGIAIQKLCSTVAQTVAWTDPKGNFSFQWGNTSAVALDASQSGGRTSSGVLGTLQGAIGPSSNASSMGNSAGLNAGPSGAVLHCELRASLAGFRSDTISMMGRRPTDNPDLGLIVLHRVGSGESGSTVSAAHLAVPKAAADQFRKAMKAEHAGDKHGAAKSFERATALYPAYAEAWMELGLLKGRDKEWADSARCLDEGLKLNPDAYPQAWYADAMAHYYLNEFDPAERSAREAVRLDPAGRNLRAGYVLGMILAQKHDYKNAAAQLRTYLEKAPNAPDAVQVKAQLAEIESLR
jgi:tetratricopeptide (TPR) repeat protein